MISARSFNVSVEEGLYSKFTDILINEFGLVDAKGYPPDVEYPPKDNSWKVLVYEDETGIGRYRIHCGSGLATEKPNDEFDFTYWSERIDKKTFQEDPMDKVLRRFLSEAKNPIEIPHMFRSIDKLR